MTNLIFKKRMLVNGESPAREECLKMMGYAANTLHDAGMSVSRAEAQTSDELCASDFDMFGQVILQKDGTLVDVRELPKPDRKRDGPQTYANIKFFSGDSYFSICATVPSFASHCKPGDDGPSEQMTDFKLEMELPKAYADSGKLASAVKKLCRSRFLGGHGYRQQEAK